MIDDEFEIKLNHNFERGVMLNENSKIIGDNIDNTSSFNRL